MYAARTFDLAGLLGFASLWLWFRAWRSEGEDQADVPWALPFVQDELPLVERRRLERLDAICRVCASSAPPGA